MVIFNIIFGIILWNLFISHINYKYKYKQNRLYCGIVGFSGKKNYHIKTLQMMLVWNSLERGEDSTGIFTPKNGRKRSLQKGSHFVLYEENQFNPDNLFIGHVRAATIGAKDNIENVHPFERGEYILAHNGTLRNHTDLATKYTLTVANNFSVDSDIVTGVIESEDDIAKAIQQINGAAAFLIHDKRKPNTLYAFRNGERPLFRGVDTNGSMYISSIDEPLYFANLRNIQEFKENVLYTIVDGEIKRTTKITNIPYAVPYVNTYNANNIDYYKFLFLKAHNTVRIVDRKRYPCDVNILKGKYYYSIGEDISRKDHILIKYETEDNSVHQVSLNKYLFDKNDVINVGDHVKLISDISGYGTTTGPAIAVKDDVFVVTIVYQDGDLKVTRLPIFGSPHPFSFCKKYNFIKLTHDEKLQAIWANDMFLTSSRVDVPLDEVDDTHVEAEDDVFERAPKTITFQTANAAPKSHSCDMKGNPVVMGAQTSLNIVDDGKDIQQVSKTNKSHHYNLLVNEEELEEFLDEVESELESIALDIEQLPHLGFTKKSLRDLQDLVTVSKQTFLTDKNA